MGQVVLIADFLGLVLIGVLGSYVLCSVLRTIKRFGDSQRSPDTFPQRLPAPRVHIVRSSTYVPRTAVLWTGPLCIHAMPFPRTQIHMRRDDSAIGVFNPSLLQPLTLPFLPYSLHHVRSTHNIVLDA